jgi:hypothetical protein
LHPAKISIDFWEKVLRKKLLKVRGKKFAIELQKKSQKSFVGIKKGFYICTRFQREGKKYRRNIVH